MKLRFGQRAEINELIAERECKHKKLIQACQSGAYKAWKKYRRQVDILNARLREFGYSNLGDERNYQNINSKDGLIKLDTNGEKI